MDLIIAIISLVKFRLLKRKATIEFIVIIAKIKIFNVFSLEVIIE